MSFYTATSKHLTSFSGGRMTLLFRDLRHEKRDRYILADLNVKLIFAV